MSVTTALNLLKLVFVAAIIHKNDHPDGNIQTFFEVQNIINITTFKLSLKPHLKLKT